MLRRTFMVGDPPHWDEATMRPTGDLAEIRNGRIYLKGRGGLVVKLLGQAVHMEEIEAAVRTAPSVVGCCSAAVTVAEGSVLTLAVVNNPPFAESDWADVWRALHTLPTYKANRCWTDKTLDRTPTPLQQPPTDKGRNRPKTDGTDDGR
eukprot:TRINITY_DN10123_c0_g1_i1.p2 TRINITY_DN10123_c0_g1~~TRINITY_DN10123_c0_g1_i1.p2  ORF type:complete len:149 (+),score=2.59 TRINITY_DN10123_c0_g1_i1:665-1111(+)